VAVVTQQGGITFVFNKEENKSHGNKVLSNKTTVMTTTHMLVKANDYYYFLR
jgi:hypothetical protein